MGTDASHYSHAQPIVPMYTRSYTKFQTQALEFISPMHDDQQPHILMSFHTVQSFDSSSVLKSHRYRRGLTPTYVE